VVIIEFYSVYFLLNHYSFGFILTTVPSPCINWCDINPESGLCRGCYRTLAEIAAWSELSSPEKLEVWSNLKARKPQAEQ
jgi:predicted Fe-S protein YdhL (DUF1289 family)